MAPSSFIHLRSTKFPILPGEAEELVNDGIYGKALAEFLKTELSQRGYDSPFVCCEDWGWWVELKGQPFTLGLCCYGFPLEDDSLDHCVSVSAAKGKSWSWTRFKMIDRIPRIESLEADLKDILESDPEIEVLGYPEEFPL